jgi:hypothetical protein
VKTRGHLLLGLAVWRLAQAANAATVNLTSAADTTLSENYPNNNLGAVAFANSGTTQNYTRNRALFRFDIAGAIPAGSRIQAAALTLEVTRQPSAGYTLSDFGLYRLLVPWGEGRETSPTNCQSCAGQGSAATTNEATWNDRFAFTTNTWAAPGAQATNDYVATPSATQTIYDVNNSPYTFGPAAAMTADVQGWLDQPTANDGWILICSDETDNFTARGYGTRESAGFAPRLQVDYLPPPQITAFGVVSNQFQLTFTAAAGQSYDLQSRGALAADTWHPLTHLNPPATDTNLVVADPLTPSNRFYRVVGNY